MASVDVLLPGYSAVSPVGSLGFCGVYLINANAATEPRRVLFDCGHVGRRRALVRALAERELTPADIDSMVLSHGHWDHIQNVDLFPRATVFLHAAERRYPQAPDPDDLATPAWTKYLLAGLDVREVREGDQVADGVSVIELPGHTAGSIGLLTQTEDGRAVLSGDAVSSARSLQSGQATVAGYNENLARESVTRVGQLARIVFPGHDAPFRVEDGRPAGYPAPPGVLEFRMNGRDILRQQPS